MALFKDHEIDDHQILSITYEGDEPSTQVDLVVHDPIIGALAKDWHLSTNSSNLSKWYRESSPELFDQERSTNVSTSGPILRSSLHKEGNTPKHFILLGDRINDGDARWGNSTPQFGEFSFIDGYWEWLEDVLARNGEMLTTTRIYDAVFASLFTYDRNTNLIRSFCEFWCPSTNSLHLPIGEASISLWDLRLIGGLSISGIFYDEVVPSARELTGVDKDNVPLLPPSCKYLFLAYCKIYCASEASIVTTHDWVKFWFKGDSRYKEPPPRVQKKRFGEPRTSNNPTGFIEKQKPRSKDAEDVFVGLGVEKELNEETNLAALLSCWLCAFVLPNKKVNQIRPSVFKIASLMARGEKISLAVPVLASIYHGLREITSSPNPSKCGASFPIHYVYGWLAHYCTSYYWPTSVKFKYGARMVRFSGEKKAKHFTSPEARDLLRSIKPSNLPLLALSRGKQITLFDNGKHPDSWSSYFISLKSSYLTFRRDNEHIVEPYCPHRFARQFRFCQDLPGELIEELSTGALEELFPLWESCTRLSTNAKFMLPMNSYEGLVTNRYVEWWRQSSSKFCTNDLTCAKPNSPCPTPKRRNVITIRSAKSKVAKEVTSPPPKYRQKEVAEVVAKGSGKVATIKLKTPLNIPASLPKPIMTKASDPTGGNKKRVVAVLSEGSTSDKDECHWKRLKKKVSISDLENIDCDVENVLGDLPDTLNYLEVLGEQVGDQFGSEDEGSVDGPSSFDLVKQQHLNRVSEAIHPPLTSKLPTSSRAAPSTVTEFNPRSKIFDARREAASYLDREIKSVLCKTPFERLASLKPKLEEIFVEFSKLQVDSSPLKNTIEKFMKNAANFISMKSGFASGMTMEMKVQRLAEVDQSLTNALAFEGQATQRAQEIHFELDGIDAKRSKLMEELELLGSEEKKLRASIEEIEAARIQKQHIVSRLQAEHADLEATEVLEPADMEVANKLEQLLQDEKDEIQNLAWLA